MGPTMIFNKTHFFIFIDNFDRWFRGKIQQTCIFDSVASLLSYNATKYLIHSVLESEMPLGFYIWVG